MSIYKHQNIVTNIPKEEKILNSVETIAMKKIKKMIVNELEKKMINDRLSKTKMAQKMQTSRSALERLLDPQNTSITLTTLAKAAHIIGKKIAISFV